MYTIKWRLPAGVMPQEAASQADCDSQSATEELQELTNRSWAALMARGPRYVSALQQARHNGTANGLKCAVFSPTCDEVCMRNHAVCTGTTHCVLKK